MIYTSRITKGGILLRESRTVARLLLDGVGQDQWMRAVLEDNVLQARSQRTATEIATLVRARLEPLGAKLWTMVCEGPHQQALQAAFAGAVKESRLLGDFLDLVVREQRAAFAKTIEYRHWSEFVEGCRGRDPEMPQWSQATIDRLRSTVFSMLAEAGYLSDTRKRELQTVFVDAELAALLRAQGESYVLRCLEVAE